MIVRFTGSMLASPDGIRVNQYHAGDVLDLPDAVAAGLIADGLAEVPTTEPEPVDEPEPVEPRTHRRRRG